MASVSVERSQFLSAHDLGWMPSDGINTNPPVNVLPKSDPILQQVTAALKLGYAGVILSGPPGTGKSWYANQIAQQLTDEHAITSVQFHPSYQYEDFIEGYAPNAQGGFQREKKVFGLLCEAAMQNPSTQYILLIDEISRCDAARVFGEALTYIEHDKRNKQFVLSSGSDFIVPSNIAILATMNSWDKGVDELDVALERRFAQVSIAPNAETLREILKKRNVAEGLIIRLVAFYQSLLGLADTRLHLGHSYFIPISDDQTADLVWTFQLEPFFRKACRYDAELFASVRTLWTTYFPVPSVPVEPLKPAQES